ncbi:MAG: MotB family protein [Hyphomicrobiaceae bacterium]|nr:MotB family protein [Hyphomicrobiaceae bacterium]
MSEDKTAQEIVIIRRRSGHEEEHGHTGLWKIAYADFMTALMAFFLVMWLVNAANKKTLQSVATYFNPMRMSDQVTSEKGLNNLAGQDKPAEGKEQKKAEEKNASTDPKEEVNAKVSNVDEQGIFRDPYGLLSELSKKAATFRRGEESVPEGGSKNTASDVYSGGEGYRDPFDPDFRQEPTHVDEIPSDIPVADGSVSREDTPPGSAAKKAAGTGSGDAQASADAAAATDEAKAAAQAVQPPMQATPASEPKIAMKSEDKTADPAAAKESAEKAEAEARELHAKIKEMTAEAKTPIPAIEVTSTGEGVLVSLMDDATFGMFSVGSARPRPEMVAIMERIAGLLKDKPGEIVVRGHTDSRPYRSKDYDNWRLSSARAHMAYYMLVRGGVADTRFDRIEGHADRELKLPADPNAAQNRRIEILIKAVKP